MKHEKKQIIIIGAGISGIGMAIQLLQNNFKDFLIIEKSNEIGGTWSENTYPGCACDVPSHLYQYSFAPKNDWSKTFAGQAEIKLYIESVANEYNLEQYIKRNTTVENCIYNEQQKAWLVDCGNEKYEANFIIGCTGYLHHPIIPNNIGLENFKGKWFHSSQWQHDIDLINKKVAVIGTGASAIQFIPQIQSKVKTLSVFQRTTQWILPKWNSDTTAWQQQLLDQPLISKTWRNLLFYGFETFGLGFRYTKAMQILQQISEQHLKQTVKDKELRKKLSPNYTLGCKRVLMSNDYYTALTKDNVEVFAEGVSNITEKQIYGCDGTIVDADIIILGTGFHVTDSPSAEKIFNTQHQSLSDKWNGSPQAYKGTTVHSFPNMFMILGPNLGIGHNSAFIVIEAQIKYIISTLNTMRDKNYKRFDVKESVQTQYNNNIQQHLKNTVWNTGGCSSYYIDKNGKNSVGFPWSTFKMQSLLNNFDSKNYILET